MISVFTIGTHNIWSLVMTGLANIRVSHISRLIKQIEQEKIAQKIRDLTRNWTNVVCLVVRHF